MATNNIYLDIANRTGGDIYIGVVGPVRTGKSTLIQQFMERLVLPNIENPHTRQRAQDEMPQSASGKTVMTTEPKFIPEEAVQVNLSDKASFRMKLIDCVGYIVEGAGGLTEEDAPRMVMTPWSDKPLPFERAAELGTKKVIQEHATIGILVTTDASFGELKRRDYEEAEKRVVKELNATHKPYVIVLNSAHPEAPATRELAQRLQEEYQHPVCLTNCYTLTEEEIRAILANVLLEFKVKEMHFSLPRWVLDLPSEDKTRQSIFQSIQEAGSSVTKMGQLTGGIALTCPLVQQVQTKHIDFGKGVLWAQVYLQDGLFYRILGEACGLSIQNESELMQTVKELKATQLKYDKVSKALEMAQSTGYGIVVPTTEDIRLEDPEVIKQPGGHGIRFKATAPSIHMIKANIETQVSPILGSEKQSEEMANFIMDTFDREPEKVWELNMFGKSLNDLMNEELSAKLEKMPQDAREKFVDMLQKIINDGSGGLICIIL